AANANSWNNSDVTVSFACTDLLSGLAPGSPPAPIVLSSEGAHQQVAGSCQDLAGNSASAVVAGINIDKTPPLLNATFTPPPNANGWSNTDVTIAFNAADALSGVAFITPPVLVQLEGKNQVVTGIATDLAGNSSSLSLPVNIDKTPPEAFNQFDPATHDVVLFGHDTLSGVAPGPITPTSVVQLSDKDDDDEDSDRTRDDRGRDHDRTDPILELRTYTVPDLAGNSLVLVEKVRRTEHSVSVHILSLQ